MTLIYHLFTIALLWLHAAALAALAGPRLGSWAIGRAGAILAVVLAGFCLEHFVGLGSLAGLWPASTVAALAYLWARRASLRAAGFLRGEAVFGLAFAYALAWKFAFPSIYPSSERVTDLYFIGNYLAGATLPPPDHWYPPYRFDFYYALQHYGAALAGRWLQLSPGLTYNLCFALLMALTLTLAWDLAARLVTRRAPRLLLLAALALGGTGAPLVNHLLVAPRDATPAAADELAVTRAWGNARFIGNFDQLGNTDFARRWFPKPPDGFAARELPLENYGYQFVVGDYHPPLGGFFLLLLALALIAALETSAVASALPWALLAATVPAMIATNAWAFPLQALLVGAWALRRQWLARRDAALAPPWPALIGGGGGTLLLLYPFLAGFAAQDLATPLRWVAAQDRTPLLPFLAQDWPLLILLALGLAGRETRRLALFFALLFAALGLVSELVYIDDPAAGQYERTNTVMKWWGWIWTGALAALGASLLAARARWLRWGATLALAGTLVYAVDLADYWRHSDMRDFGRLAGDALYTSDPAVRDLFRYLAAAPEGIVLENLYRDAYSDADIYAAFAAKPSLVGWPNHLSTWHAGADDFWQRRDAVKAFYAGTLADAPAWLAATDVRYIVWNATDAQQPTAWQRWQRELAGAYRWQGFGLSGDAPIGLWVRR